MTFAASEWLFGTALGGLFALALVLREWARRRALRRFGDEALVSALVAGGSTARRALKGVLGTLGVALVFVAAAQPRYGRGTRIVPATQLDVVVVLDYSKSMYARDVSPSRIVRAKTEVATLISALPGARFGAVAFAGEPLSFPLTSDGGAIAQFFRQLSPLDMPVGGTAIARALEAARDVLSRDPRSREHRRVILLVTDGEDLEGDPVKVAEAAGREETSVWVVQIGGRTPEPIPEVNELGEVVGWRTDAEGRMLTTSLTAAGEEQLGRIAAVAGGRIIRAGTGDTGLPEAIAALRGMMRGELAETVETVWAEVYHWPLGLALLLLLLEASIGEGRRRRAPDRPPTPPRQVALRRGGLALSALALLASCEESPFQRRAPQVERALRALDAGEAADAALQLQEYLATGRCEGGSLGVPDRVHQRPQASFDLGLALFELAERFGVPFQEPPPSRDGGPSPEQAELDRLRGEQVDCALRIVRALGEDPKLPASLRARAHAVAGNLELLRGDARSAVRHYDSALELSPGLPGDAGDGLGRDVAWNRAIALRRLEDEENRKRDSTPPEGGTPDAGSDAAPESGGPDGSPEAGGADSGDDRAEAGSGRDGGDAGAPASPEAGSHADAGGPPPPSPTTGDPGREQDERVLDELERTPLLQHQSARGRGARGRSMEDK